MNSNREIHYRYAIAFLVLVIIWLVAFGFYDLRVFVERVSFAQTVTSIVLSIIAITYTFLSTNKQEAQLARLVDTQSSITQSAVAIERTASTLTDIAGLIPKRLDTLDSRLETMLQPLPSGGGKATAAQDVAEIGEKEFHSIFVNLRYAGMVSLYMFEQARAKDREITEDLVDKVLERPGFHFAFGVLSGLEAVGLLQFKVVDGKRILPVSSAPVVKARLGESYETVLKILGDEKSKFLRECRNVIDEELR